MNRLKDADFFPGPSLSPALFITEKSIAYDLNGNITALKRYGSSGLENELSFTHSGNRMTALTDAQATGSEAGTKTFTYDANGNLTYDGRQDLDIRWNIFNLASGAETHDGGSLTLARLSDGTLFAQQKVSGGNTTGKRYCGSFIFATGNGLTTPQVESVAWDEGRIFADAAGNYHDCWFAGDHLGNVRSVLDITPDVTVPIPLEQNDYLPFGTKIANPLHAQMNTNRWRYAGKEEFPDLNLLDFGARMYDPFTARWTAVDPMARGCSHISSYAYCYGNPLRYADPNGCDGWDKTVGYAIGFITNIVPGSSSLRDLYSPNDPEDYNGALKSSDDAAMLVGEALSKGGMLMTGTGSAVTGVGVVMMGTGGGIMLSGVGAPEGGAVFVYKDYPEFYRIVKEFLK